MTAPLCPGLVLTWHRTKGTDYVLSLLFGITGSVCSLFLRFGRDLLVKALEKGRIGMCSHASTRRNIATYRFFRRQVHDAKNVYCVADGLKLYLEQSGDSTTQNMFYNGWTHDHYGGNVFVFVPSGLVLACAINAPGAIHNSIIAEWGGVYEKLMSHYDEHGGNVSSTLPFRTDSTPL